MHILWLTGVQLPAVTGKNLNRAGWQEGLRRALEMNIPEVKLSIASFGPEDYAPFSAGNATYYNIFRRPPPNSRWKKIIQNWTHKTYSKDELGTVLDLYESIKPDLVFIFGTENPFGLLVTQFSAPTIVSIQAVLHGLVQNYFSGLTLTEMIKEFLSLDVLFGRGIYHRWWVIKKYLRTERTIFERCHFFTGRTEWDRVWLSRINHTAKYFKIDRVLGDSYYKANWNFHQSNQNQIFCVSSNAPFKGGITLTRAMVVLNARGNDQINLRITGIQPESSAGKHISKLIDRYHLKNQITLLGRLQPEEIVQEMLKARVFVLPSHMDNSPNSLAEAMLVGMPCIASNAGGIPSMITNEVDGLSYDHMDINSLANTIEHLLGNPDLAQQLAQNAKNVAKKRHDPAKIATDSFLAYRQVITQSSTR